MDHYPDRPWLTQYPANLAAEIPQAEHETVAEFAVAAMRKWADHPAFDNMGTVLRYADIERLSRDFAAYLRGPAGLVEGDRIIIVMPNVLQFPVALFGALRAGLIPVNANPLYTAAELGGIVAEAEPRAIVVLENFAHVVANVVQGSSLETVIVTRVGDLFGAPKRFVIEAALAIGRKIPPYEIPGHIHFRDALDQGARCELAPVTATRTDVALLQFTGGTSGTPKAVMLTHANLLANQSQLATPGSIPLTHGSEVVLTALPLYHIFCFTVNCLALFGMGSLNVLVTNPRDIRGLVKTIARTRPTVTMLVSTLAAALLDDERFRGLDFSRVKLDIAGGMAVREQVSERWRRVTGHPLLEGYGLTEASPVVALNPLWGGEKAGTIGIPLPSTEVRMVDVDGAPVALGTVGEMAVRGPQVMKGYWNRPEETATAVTADGWLLTGDIGRMDDEGFITIVDRKKDLIVVGGFNVYPNEVEAVITGHPGVADAGVIGVPDEYSGEVVRAFVVRTDPSLTAEALLQYCRQRLTGYKRPRSIVFVDELPKSSVGKVLRRALRDVPQS